MEDWVADTVCHHPWSIHNKIERPQARINVPYIFGHFFRNAQKKPTFGIWTFVYLRNIVHFLVLVGISFLRNKVCKTLHHKTAPLTNLVEAVAYLGYI